MLVLNQYNVVGDKFNVNNLEQFQCSEVSPRNLVMVYHNKRHVFPQCDHSYFQSNDQELFQLAPIYNIQDCIENLVLTRL